jgi:hypothetical protein
VSIEFQRTGFQKAEAQAGPPELKLPFMERQKITRREFASGRAVRKSGPRVRRLGRWSLQQERVLRDEHARACKRAAFAYIPGMAAQKRQSGQEQPYPGRFAH